MDIEKRILKFITRMNWTLLVVTGLLSLAFESPGFSRGVIFGGLIVTVNFHLLARTLKRSLKPPFLASHNSVLTKYYIRFIASGVVIFILISTHFVNPLALILGLSVVVASIIMATFGELTKLIFKEAV